MNRIKQIQTILCFIYGGNDESEKVQIPSLTPEFDLFTSASNIIFLHFHCSLFTFFFLFILNSMNFRPLSLCSFCLYFHGFSDMFQTTPPFLLFLPAIHLPLLSPLIILSHLLPEAVSINGGEISALTFLFHSCDIPCSFFLFTCRSCPNR